MNELQKVMDKRGTPTLKAIAIAINVTAARVYAAAKVPKEGEVYNAKEFNWDAIEAFVGRRLGDELGMTTFDEVVVRALELDEALKEQDKRRRVKREKIEVDGKLIHQRKGPHLEMASGIPVILKEDGAVYKIVHQTVSHTVLVPVSPNGEPASQEVKVLSNLMLNMKSIPAKDVDAALEERGF